MRTFVASLLFVLSVAVLPAREFDLILRGGTVIDGSGAARRVADVGIVGDRIAAVGNLTGSTAVREIDVTGLMVVPGFIDLHGHLDDNRRAATGLRSPDPRRRAAQNYIAQGVTTAAVNPDGWQAEDLVAQRRELQRLGIGVNAALFNGHNVIRELIMRNDRERAATAEEITAMAAIVRRGQADEGSFGLTLGLEYDSGRFAQTDELHALFAALASFGGVCIAHQRSQGIAPMWYRPSVHRDIEPPTLESSLSEMIDLAETSGVTTVVTHMKGWGPHYRGTAQTWIDRIQAARDRGVRLFIDLYPYVSAGSDGRFVMLPPWILGGKIYEPHEKVIFDYAAALERALAAGDMRERLERDVIHQVALKGGAENIVVLEFAGANYAGRTIAELMRECSLSLVDLAIALQREGDPHEAGGVRLRAISMDERDLDLYYAQPWTATATDGWIVLPEEAVGHLKYFQTNQRCFGTYPRRLAVISGEHRVDSLEEAVRKCSRLPAEILGLSDRGVLAPGWKADVVVLDLARLRDNTTVAEPSVYPTGVEHVWVNGVAVVANGKRTLALPGVVLDPRGRAAKEH